MNDPTQSDPGLRRRISNVREALRKEISHLTKLEEEVAKQRKKIDDVYRYVDLLEAEIPLAFARENKRKDATIKRLERELKSAERKAAKVSIEQPAGPHPADLSRAKTIAIFGGILFAIENWSACGQTAADFTIVCQSLLFPIVYEKVMSGDEDYYIETVPASALEVVRRGREFVRHLREESDISLVTDESWNEACNVVHEWLVNDALPLLYGARDDAWEDEVPYSLAQMQQWRDLPQSRLLDFPKIQDGMDLVKLHGDIIRNDTGLPTFTKQTLETRIQL